MTFAVFQGSGMRGPLGASRGRLFALGPGDGFKGTPGRDDLLKAIEERGMASGMVIATYTRPDGTIKAGAPRVVMAPTE